MEKPRAARTAYSIVFLTVVPRAMWEALSRKIQTIFFPSFSYSFTWNADGEEESLRAVTFQLMFLYASPGP